MLDVLGSGSSDLGLEGADISRDLGAANPVVIAAGDEGVVDVDRGRCGWDDHGNDVAQRRYKTGRW